MSGAWIQTYTGRQFWPLDPRPEDVDILDIARGLAMECRYGGQCKWFYPVAQHSVLLARAVPEPYKLWALLHDSPEGLGLKDIARPVKPHLKGYSAAEERLMRAVAERFGLSWPMPAIVKEYDTRILHDEKAALMGPPPADWDVPGEPLGVVIEEWTWQRAEGEFLACFEELTAC